MNGSGGRNVFVQGRGCPFILTLVIEAEREYVIIDDLVIVPNWITEGKIHALANDLNEDPDILLALSGKISKDIQKIIRKRPLIFAQLIRELKNMPDNAVLRIVREVRDGNW